MSIINVLNELQHILAKEARTSDLGMTITVNREAFMALEYIVRRDVKHFSGHPEYDRKSLEFNLPHGKVTIEYDRREELIMRTASRERREDPMFDKFMETMMPLVESHIKEEEKERPRIKPSRREVQAKKLAREAREQANREISIMDEIEDL
jgi:hypothetical protein